MKWLKYTIFLVMLLPALAQAQYRGSGRPLSRQETLDSLAAKLDTSAVAAGDNVTVDWDGSSLTIASSGGGGNWSPVDSTLSLDLPYYFSRNVVHQWGADVYSTIVNHSAGEHGDSTTNFLTDDQSIGVYVPASGALDGIYYPVPYGDWTHWTDGDTMELGGTYFCISIKLDSVSQARLPVDGMRFLSGRPNNNFKANIVQASLSEGWNHIKILLSAFTVNAGSPSWAQCDTLYIMINGTASGDGPLIFLVENVQLVRGIDGEPNPYQSEGPDGTWTADWTQEGNGNVWLVEESGKLGVMSPETATASYIKYAKSFGDFDASGTVEAGQNDAAMFYYALPASIVGVFNNNFRIRDSTNTYHSTVLVIADGDVIDWKLQRRGPSISGQARVNGGSWVSVSTFCKTANIQPILAYWYGGERIRSMGLGSVAYANLAGEALRLRDWFPRIVGDSLQVTHGDSIFNLLINSRRAK